MSTLLNNKLFIMFGLIMIMLLCVACFGYEYPSEFYVPVAEDLNTICGEDVSSWNLIYHVVDYKAIDNNVIGILYSSLPARVKYMPNVGYTPYRSFGFYYTGESYNRVLLYYDITTKTFSCFSKGSNLKHASFNTFSTVFNSDGKDYTNTYSDYDIYNVDGSEIVFHQPPVLHYLTVRPAVQAKPGEMVEELTTLIPVGLIILSMLLVVSLVLLVKKFLK